MKLDINTNKNMLE